MNFFDIKNNKLSLCMNILGVFVLITGLIFFFVSIPFSKNKDISLYKYKYDVQRNVVPQFNLKQDSGYYYDELVSNTGVYPAVAIDNMYLNMSYLFNGDRDAVIDYTYNVNAQLIGDFDGVSSPVWKKEFTLLDNVTNQSNNSFKINERVGIDYQYYNNLVREYKSTYQLAINAYLKVRLNVSYNCIYDGDKFNKTDFVEVNIPLNEYVSEVKKNYQDVSTEQIEDIKEVKIDYVTLYFGIIFVTISIILFIVASNKKEVTRYSKYKKNMDRVLKEYGDLIVTVTNKPSIKHLQVMGLATIDDLVDVADQNNCHIIRYEIEKKSESFLLVIQSGYVYVYVVSDAELKFAK